MIKWGIIGLGNIAYRFTKAIAPSTTGTIVAIGSRNQEKQNRFKELIGHDVLCFKDYKQLIESDQVDAIYVALPHGMHYEYAKYALEHHKHVLCEKPATLSYNQTKELSALSIQNHVVFMEAMKNHFIPFYKDIIQKLKEGIIGDIHYIEANFCYDVSNAPRKPGWYLFDKIQGGALYDVGPYPLSFLLSFKDDSYTNLEVESRILDDVDSYVKATFTYPDLTFICEVAIDENKERYALVRGSKGEMKIPYYYRPNDYTVTYNDGTQKHIENKLDFEDMYYEIEAFHQYVTTNNPNPTDFTHAQSQMQSKLIEEVKAKIK